jgi:hypothetical protein
MMDTLHFIKQFYHKMPANVQLYIRLFMVMCQKPRLLFLPVHTWNGKSRDNQLPLSVAYVGNNTITRHYYLHLFFRPAPEITYAGKIFFIRIFKTIRKKYPACTMILWEPNPFIKWRLRNQQPFILPDWVQLEIDISQSIRTMEKQSRSGYINFRRLIRKYGYSYTLSENTDREFEDFYQNMYVPYAKYRFGDSALLPDCATIFDPAYQPELFLYKKENRVVAGSVIRYKDDVALCHALGVQEDCFEMAQQGILGATYLFIIDVLQKRGYKKLCVGGVRPIWNDGVVRLKVRLLATISGSYHYAPGQCTYLSALYDSPCIRDFLVHNPFVHLAKNGELTGAIWISKNEDMNEEGFRKVYKRMERAGIRHCDIFSFRHVPLSPPTDENSSMTASIHSFHPYFVYP